MYFEKNYFIILLIGWGGAVGRECGKKGMEKRDVYLIGKRRRKRRRIY